MTYNLTQSDLDKYFPDYLEFKEKLEKGEITESEFKEEFDLRFDSPSSKFTNMVTDDIMTFGKVVDVVERDAVFKAQDEKRIYVVQDHGTNKLVTNRKGDIRSFVRSFKSKNGKIYYVGKNNKIITHT